uniref:Uncharacterized protein n=1 Tax=Haptolina brevifila TaxID=156173 RepID=A0A7S2N0G4_9EUKA|mmetsp:Transcript_63336/g.125201  ORF Transcript_63336/g.125201 Transcript_63336/m.125201 type:complete len:369 (+) Transcript_63336:46-1152(+)|eukprot:CAMPEP_0174714586 /NCGR_PEP_ID=MMETSP1094-20130205/18604_1 /TAXON_ID=156173 /ORGANISM="Chrysochromulina brevifilum, Strain UTEX LB 985" /LENGTH=368 /DNA_ID=CAMNT_0015913971 /DNA_START=47 /DNA_END=1153 /DNA_ORIENTATION=-
MPNVEIVTAEDIENVDKDEPKVDPQQRQQVIDAHRQAKAMMKVLTAAGISEQAAAAAIQSGDPAKIQELAETAHKTMPDNNIDEAKWEEVMDGFKELGVSEEEAMEAAKKLEAEQPEMLLGQHVQISGLTGRQELNEQIGKVLEYKEDRGRFVVKLEASSEKVLMRRDNLTVVVLKEPPKPGKHPAQIEDEQKEKQKRQMRLDAGLNPSEPRPEDYPDEVPEEETDGHQKVARLVGLTMDSVRMVKAQLGKENIIVYLEPHAQPGAYQPPAGESFFYLVAKVAPAMALYGKVLSDLGLPDDTPIELSLGKKNRGFFSSGEVRLERNHRMSKYSGKQADDETLHVQVRIPTLVERTGGGEPDADEGKVV